MIKEICGEWEVNNNCPVEHPVKDCSWGGLCAYPFCEHNLDCKQENLDEVEVKNVGSVKQYFDYQKELNNLKNKIEKSFK